MNTPKIVIGGFTPFTTIDFPGHLAAVIFTQGCVLRCPFCYNSHLHSFEAKHEDLWVQTMAVLKERVNFLDGVVFSGGEPIVQEGIVDAVKEVKSLGYKIGLHTSGILPEKVKELIPLVDWIGLDMKGPVERYDEITKGKNSGEKAVKSLDFILDSGLDFEVRTTVDPRILSKEDIISLGYFLSEKGVKTYALQEYEVISDKQDEPNIEMRKQFFDPEFVKILKPKFENLILREG
jgi:anaerobic ribonucleoside-triphosphate reductase activating protein